jgi:hypothetical protein
MTALQVADKCTYAKNHVEYLSNPDVLGIDFTQSENIAKNNITHIKDKVKEKMSTELEKKDKYEAAYLAATDTVDFFDTESIEKYITKEENLKSLCRAWNVKFKDIDRADLPIVANRISIKFVELVKLGWLENVKEDVAIPVDTEEEENEDIEDDDLSNDDDDTTNHDDYVDDGDGYEPHTDY